MSCLLNRLPIVVYFAPPTLCTKTKTSAFPTKDNKYILQGATNSRPEISTPYHLPFRLAFRSKRHQGTGLNAIRLTFLSVRGRPYNTLGHTVGSTQPSSIPDRHSYGEQQVLVPELRSQVDPSSMQTAPWRFRRDAFAYAVAGSAIRRARVEKRIVD